MLLNCDMGEALTPNPDPDVMPWIDLANIACGGHAGNIDSISTTLQLAQKHQVKVGAHPSYPDPQNFGRQSLSMSPTTLLQSLNSQFNLIDSIARPFKIKLHHLKPHGALYLDMMKSPQIFQILLDFCQSRQLPLMIQAGVEDKSYQQLAHQKGVPLYFEVFADRAYLENGQLAPRSQPNSLYLEPSQIVQQTADFIAKQQAGQLKADTVCFHSDNPASVEALKMIKAGTT